MNNEYIIKKVVVSQQSTIEYTYRKLLNKKMLKPKCYCIKDINSIIYCIKCQTTYDKLKKY
jgi:hypothetical protein